MAIIWLKLKSSRTKLLALVAFLKTNISLNINCGHYTLQCRVSQIGSTGGGDNLGKMAKNCMKMTKSAFWVKTVGGHGRRGKPIFPVVGGGLE